jgi:hypothetical protein
VLRRERDGDGLGGDDLTAVARIGDPERAVHVDADVAVVVEHRRRGVEPDADPHRLRPGVAAESPLRLDGGGGRLVRGGEGGEELVAARVDLVAAGARDGLSQQAADVGEDGGPVGAELPRQARGALDVREEEGDCPGG